MLCTKTLVISSSRQLLCEVSDEEEAEKMATVVTDVLLLDDLMPVVASLLGLVG